MTTQQDPGTEKVTATGRATTRPVQARDMGLSRSSTPEAATITAELPVVRDRAGVPVRRAPGVMAVSRQTAPVALRAFVWILALVLAIDAAGAIVAKVRPDALSVLRNTSTGVSSPSASASNTAATAPTGALTTGIHETASTSTSVRYAVPARSYDLVVVLSAPTWIEEHVPAGGKNVAYAKTAPAGSTQHFSVAGSCSISFGKAPASFKVISGTKVIGTVQDPRLGVIYTFEPSATA